MPSCHGRRTSRRPAPVTGSNVDRGRDSGLEIEVLPASHHATLWPYRPKRLADELLSSWLWRVARGLGAPPRRFTLDAIGVDLADIDRDIGDDAIARLAFLSGQSEAHLLRGTMRPDVPIDSDDDRENVQRALLRHGDLVPNRSRRGRSKPIIQDLSRLPQPRRALPATRVALFPGSGLLHRWLFADGLVLVLRRIAGSTVAWRSVHRVRVREMRCRAGRGPLCLFIGNGY